MDFMDTSVIVFVTNRFRSLTESLRESHHGFHLTWRNFEIEIFQHSCVYSSITTDAASQVLMFHYAMMILPPLQSALMYSCVELLCRTVNLVVHLYIVSVYASLYLCTVY